MQITGGNNYYLDPQTPIKASAPTFEINFLKSAKLDSTHSGRGFFMFGFNYSNAVQEYNVSKNQYTPYVGKSNEVLFNLGGGIKFEIGRSFFLLSLYGCFGPTYTHSNEPYISNSIVAGYSGSRRNVHEFFEMYLGGFVFYGIEISKRVSLLAGTQARYFLFNDDFGNLGLEGTNIKFNYATQKVSVLAGLQVKFGK
jgi:hypothetical protein